MIVNDLLKPALDRLHVNSYGWNSWIWTNVTRTKRTGVQIAMNADHVRTVIMNQNHQNDRTWDYSQMKKIYSWIAIINRFNYLMTLTKRTVRDRKTYSAYIMKTKKHEWIMLYVMDFWVRQNSKSNVSFRVIARSGFGQKTRF